jgi:hypothetical protein
MSNTTTLSIEVELPTAKGGVEKKQLNFKSLALLPLGIVRATRNDNTEQMWQAFEWALSAKDLALFDQLPASKVYDILRAMQEASQVDLGESPASSGS